MNSKESKNSNYIPYLDGLRAIAAIYVVMHHISLQFKFDYSHFNSIQSRSISIFFFGHYAVNFFIVLSGFCLTIPFIKNNHFKLNHGIIHFYRKRFKRIALPYFFALIFSLILIMTIIGKKTGTHWDVSLPISINDVITHLLLIQDLFSNTAAKINHAMWSISVECRIYLFFPFLLLIWRKGGPIYCVLSSVLISIIIYLVTKLSNNLFTFKLNSELDGVNPYIILFVLGMLAAHIAFNSNRSNTGIVVPWLLLSFLLLIGEQSFMNITYIRSLPYSFEIDDVMFGCVSFCFLIGISRPNGAFFQNIFSCKPLVFIGNFAFSIYLIHAPLIQLIWLYIISPFNLNSLSAFYALTLLGLPLIIGISYLFYLLFERPFLNHKNRPKII